MKKYLICVLLLVLAIPANTANADLFANETFTMSINSAPADESSYEDWMPSNGPFTFVSGSEVNIGTSLFDADVDIFLSTDETVVDAVTSTIDIRMFGRDNNTSDFANPLGDGSLAQNGEVFTIPFVDLGVFNGGSDLLTPAMILPNQTGYVINAGFVGILNGAGELGGTNSPGIFSSSPDGISTSVGFNLGSDLSILDLNTVNSGIWTQPGEMVGWSVQFSVTVVPEPGTAAIIGLMGLGIVCTRRRKS